MLRKAAVKDIFYPGESGELKGMIDKFLDGFQQKKLDGKLKALIVPHAGYRYSGSIAAEGYKYLKGLDQSRCWKILLLGPSHHLPFYGAAPSSSSEWELPFGNIFVKDVRDELESFSEISEVQDVDIEEHSLEVQVPFIQRCLKNFELYPLLLGQIRAEKLANDLLDFCSRDDVVVVVSSDLSHFKPYKDAQDTDLETCNAIKEGDVERFKEVGDACGRKGIETLMHISEKLNWQRDMLTYKNSGDTASDKSRVVGYTSFIFYK